MPPAKAVDRAYRAVLSRPPSPRELALGKALLTLTHGVPQGEQEEVWMDDDLPQGARGGGSDKEESWSWVETPVFSGKRAHTQGGVLYEVQRHFALEAANAFRLGPDDRLFAYVYLDPQNPPKQVLMQWNDGAWANRAVYWGDDALPAPGSFTRYRIGPLPEAGEWVRLEVPAREVGLRTDSGAINGWSFENFGGRVFWDKCGIVRVPRNPAAEPVGDLLWALFSSPEFQFVR
jgi:hypothetical protein